MQRRSLLHTAALSLSIGIAGCAKLSQPKVRMESGSGTLHPTTDRVIADGLQPDGEDRLYATIVPDEAPDKIGPDADDSIVDVLQNPGAEEQFHGIVQLRSAPDNPKEVWPVTGSAFEWRNRSTLQAEVDIDSWGAERLDEELRSAQELVYTGIWNLQPRPEELPSELVLQRTELPE